MSSFEFKPATREQTPLLVGLVGPSGCGKTYSALRLATGIQTVVGGSIAVIDTEARRSLHYADRFKFLHLAFDPPHGPDRYLEAIKAALQAGAKTIVVDSMSHEHEGNGGVLEQHETELDRLAGDDYRKREAMNFLAWAKPKAARRKLINGLLQMQANLVFCFRAKEKIKLLKDATGKTKPVQIGWQAIAGEEYVFEMTDRFLLPPGANGIPDLSEEARREGVPKMPADHASIVVPGAQLDENMGSALAQWALGSTPQSPKEPFDVHKLVKSFKAVGVTIQEIRQHLGDRAPTADDKPELERWYRERKRAHQAASASVPEGQQRPAGVDA